MHTCCLGLSAPTCRALVVYYEPTWFRRAFVKFAEVGRAAYGAARFVLFRVSCAWIRTVPSPFSFH